MENSLKMQVKKWRAPDPNIREKETLKQSRTASFIGYSCFDSHRAAWYKTCAGCQDIMM
jgi:hypothetical protein